MNTIRNDFATLHPAMNNPRTNLPQLSAVALSNAIETACKSAAPYSTFTALTGGYYPGDFEISDAIYREARKQFESVILRSLVNCRLTNHASELTSGKYVAPTVSRRQPKISVTLEDI